MSMSFRLLPLISLPIAALLVLGCAPMAPREVAEGRGGPPAGPEQAAPRWRPAGDLVGRDAAVPADTGPVSSAPVERIDGTETLRAELLPRCAGPANSEASLRVLVTELYAGGADPAAATEALLTAGCGQPEAIVRELVAQGGDAALMPVIERAVAVRGPEFRAAAETAADDGLGRWRQLRGLEASRSTALLAGSNPSYSMIYFPLGGSSGRTERSTSLAQLYGAAAPGYGIYTFVLFGDPAAGSSGIETYSELLRVVETYVLASESSPQAPDRRAHTFLVPAHGERDGGTLLDRTGPELSQRMRAELGAYLRQGGQLELAQRLVRQPGPFLVSSLEPRLVPVDPAAPRLIVDLSDVGPEYMYTVVDAYDRVVPEEHVGGVASLAAIRTRLMEMFPHRAIDTAAAPAPAGGWVYLFGGGRQTALEAGLAAAPLLAAAAEGRGASAAVTP